MPEQGPQNEADVREDIAAPMLAALGYARGTENDIEREKFLRYEALQLGRKKRNDLPLGGKADYLLTVAGAGRWVLETKPPAEEIDLDTIDQTISYARHPEVSGQYAAVLNGKRFMLFDRSKSSNDLPLLDLSVTTGVALAAALEALLSPAAIRRDCGPPIVDLNRPLAAGLRSRAKILGGEIRHQSNWWDCPAYIPQQMRDAMAAGTKVLDGLISNVSGGEIWRDETSRIRAKLKWSLPHQGMVAFIQQTNFENFEYVCLDEMISNNAERPTVFELLGAFRVEQGQKMFNVVSWSHVVAQASINTVLRAQATGYLSEDTFAGIAIFQNIMRLQELPDPIIHTSEVTFEVKVDTR